MAKVLCCGDLMPGGKAVIERKNVNEVTARRAEHRPGSPPARRYAGSSNVPRVPAAASIRRSKVTRTRAP